MGTRSPVSGKIGKTNLEGAPQYSRMGFGHHIENDLFLSLQIEKQSGQPADFFGFYIQEYFTSLPISV
jgi:hypothetical protein